MRISLENREFMKQVGLIFILLILSIEFGYSQKRQDSFSGVLVYSTSARDTLMQGLVQASEMLIYTNDTVSRTENSTGQFGKQVVIKHMELNKSYLLLNTPMGKFAIRTDHAKSDTASKPSAYSFKKKWFKRKILGRKANRVLVSHESFESPIEFLYFKKVKGKYNEIFPEIPGLIVKYSIATADGVIDYELTKFNEYTPNRDLFGVPSDYKRVSFDEFVDLMTGPQNQEN